MKTISLIEKRKKTIIQEFYTQIIHQLLAEIKEKYFRIYKTSESILPMYFI